MGAELFGDLLDLKEGLAGSKETEEAKPEEIRRIRLLKDEILADGDCLSLKDLALTGRDVMEETELRGPLVEMCIRDSPGTDHNFPRSGPDAGFPCGIPD